jgi:hypothetical protein
MLPRTAMPSAAPNSAPASPSPATEPARWAGAVPTIRSIASGVTIPVPTVTTV